MSRPKSNPSPSRMAANNEEEKKARDAQACDTAETFVRLYYDRIDTKRHVMEKLYLGTAVLSWNGNKVEGADAIQRFLLALPSSEHDMTSLDAQPVLDVAVSGQTTVAVQVRERGDPCLARIFNSYMQASKQRKCLSGLERIVRAC